MKKVFVTSVSLQGKKDLEKVFYHPEGFELKNNRETSFPIVPVIASVVNSGEEAEVIAVRSDNMDTPDNYEKLLAELKEIGIEKSQVKELSVVENQSKEVGIRMLMALLREIPEDSLVYADITFGTKPMSALVLYAMNSIEKVKDTEVQGIYYGELPRINGVPVYEKAKIYNLTVFQRISNIIEHLDELEIKDILGALDRLMEE